MSKLDELIKELCPEGVEYKKLGEIGTFERGRRFVHADDRDVGIPCIHYGELYTHYGIWAKNVKTHINSDITTKLRYADKNDVIIVAAGENKIDIGVAVAWLGEEKVAIHDACYIFRHAQNPIFLSYIFRTHEYHQFLKKYVAEGKICSVSSDAISKYEIPVPPLQVQNEIVRILDKFTSLEAELEAELEARRKQYEYYRDSLLTFGDVVEWKSLDELCTKVTDGSHFSPKAVEQGYPMPSVKDMRYNCFDLTDCKRISQSDYDTLVKAGCKPQINDVVIAKDGSMLKYAFAIKENLDLVILSSIAILKPKTNIINPDFFAHYFRQESFRELVIRDYSSKGGVPRIVLKNFKKIKIPVPTLEKQLKIVAILDRFESLCNDITSGLPAEIAARHKQYEYYRDKLLTFKRKEG